MKTITLNLFTFDELSDSAKEVARNWYRNGALDHEWLEFIYDDAKNIGLEITSFDLDRNRHAKGKFIGYAEKCAKKIISEHGHDCETFKTANMFLKDRASLVELHADETCSNGITYDGDEAIEKLESDFLRSLLEDYAIILQNEYEYSLSNECVDESILCNGYTFEESGKQRD